MINIKSKNITLRPIKLSDAELFFWCEQDKEARKNFMSTPKTIKEVKNGIKETIKEMKKKRPNKEAFAIIYRDSTVGKIWVDGMNNKFEKHKASVGYMILKDYRGKGIGTEAIKLITNYAFKRYKLKRIWAYTRTFNIGSRKALEKAGYKLEGILRKNKFKDGKYLDDCIYAIVK
jgi:RimJ/RimL family protein N-acetyltransferase